MSAIALVAMELGVHVTGSDATASENTERVEARGAKVHIGHSAAYLGEPDAVVVSTAIAKDNPEVVEARRRGIRILHRAEMLAAIMEQKKGIAISGTHGKTTTTSMMALVFERTGQRPTWVVGGIVRDLGSGAAYGDGDYLIAEADESDASFLVLRPFVTVATNIDNDHLDHYGTFGRIVEAFEDFLGRTQPGGFSVLCSDDPNLARVAGSLDGRVVTYSLEASSDLGRPHYRAGNLRREGWGSRFTVEGPGGRNLGEFSLAIPGRHNVSNATAVIAVASELGLPLDGVRASLAAFTGAGRRLQRTGRAAGVDVVDDYAHHPTEIATTLKALRELVPGGRVVVVFQPHRYTRTRDLYREFGRSFKDADLVVLTGIYAATEPPIPGVTGELIYRNFEKGAAQGVYYVAELEDVAPFLASRVRAGDLVLTMGAGDVRKAGPALLALLDGAGGQSRAQAAAGLAGQPDPAKRP